MHSTNVPEQWCLCGKHSSRWAGLRESPPSKRTTQQPMALSTTPSCQKDISPWICAYIGCAAARHKANSGFLGSRHRQLGRLLQQTLLPHPPREPASTFCGHPPSGIIALPTRQLFLKIFLLILYFYSLTLGVWEYKLYPQPSNPKSCFSRVSTRFYCTYLGRNHAFHLEATWPHRHKRPISSNTKSRAGGHGGSPLISSYLLPEIMLFYINLT